MSTDRTRNGSQPAVVSSDKRKAPGPSPHRSQPATGRRPSHVGPRRLPIDWRQSYR